MTTRTEVSEQATTWTDALFSDDIFMADDDSFFMVDDDDNSMVVSLSVVGGAVTTSWSEVSGVSVTDYMIADHEGSLLVDSDGAYLTITGEDLSNWVEIT